MKEDRVALTKELAARIRARLTVLGLSAQAASRKAGLDKDTIRNITRKADANVSHSPGWRIMEQLAVALEVTPEWLSGRKPAVDVEPPRPAPEPPAQSSPVPEPEFFDKSNKMPVYASAEGGEGELIVDTDPVDWVERPYTLAHVKKAYAIIITGDSMHPAFKPGDKAWVNPQMAPLGGDDCVLYAKDHALGEMRALIKEFVRSNGEYWIVKQYNPPIELKLEKSEWQKCFKVVGKFHRG
jgi:phage repressor protein C with HTH and peptisase S24 domain